MRVLVCGGRRYSNSAALNRELDRLHLLHIITLVIHGAALGADKLAQSWAESRGVSFARFPANWKRYGIYAGPLRNKKMLEEGAPDLVIAFPGGKGTADMMRQARAAGVTVQESGRYFVTAQP